MKPEKIILHIQNETGRVDKVIAELLEKYTRSQIQSWIKQGHILINNKQVKVNYKVNPGDCIVLEEPEEEPLKMESENIPLDIIFEDESVLVVNKPSGMVVHPSKGHVSGTLVNALLFHVNELSEGTAYIRPGIVHRIDKDTSGLLVIAKNNTAHQKLADQFHDHTIERQYTALVHGNVQHEEGTIDAPIGRMQNNRLKRTVAKEGKPAITHFTRIEEFQKFTLLKLRLETGRTHQIRVHMVYIGHPLLGDPMYGPFETVHKQGQFLHADTLGFLHPVTNEWMKFQAPLPDYFENKLRELAE
ncbi:RluA family pseudouridine synthase [Jeotgalibaca sp. MA1X17-3]|uniref:RluA family pseudouridine synthase n=1 Tax=Jeotgalibaca sp. MA1X17-3 TaxID=2908211 RepID=UPI001F3F39EF|nr:RluA family pseudouridine synthase [Jeotgalibaca sp. MA1X17-3]UJF14756.1 RluA family pseudouridine synthase [Jeotgalibaca sp. MA1X17-3]